MNRVYKVIWSKAKHCYVVTSEIARSVTKSASSARSAGRKGAAVLAMAALLFTAGGVLGEAATANVTDVSGSSEARNLIIVTKDDGTSTNFSINDVAHAKDADHATEATKATSDGNGEVIHNIYARKADVEKNLSDLDKRIIANTEAVVKVGQEAGENFTDLYAKVQTNADAVAAEAAARKTADQNNLKVGDDGVISKVSNDGTTPSAVKTLVLKVDGDNQITMDEKGIKVGLNSGVMDKDGFYAGGDDYEHASAALKWDGSIKGADGKFTVDKDGSIKGADGKFTVDKDGKADIGGDLTVKGKLNVDEIDLTKTGIETGIDGDYHVTSSTKVAAGKITSYKKATSAKDGSEKESGFAYDENGTSTWAKSKDADENWNKSRLTVEGTGIKSTATDGKKTASTNLSNNGFNTYATDGTNKTYTKQTATDIKNTAKNGTISNSAKDLGNTASENMTNNVGKNLETTVGGEMKTTVTGKVTEDFKSDLTTTIGGNKSEEVKGTSAETVTGKKTETYNGGLETTVTGEEKHTVNGSQTITVTGDSSLTAENGTISNSAKDLVNTASENMTNNVGKDLTTTVGGNMSTIVTGTVTEDFKSDLTTTIGRNKSETVAGTSEETVTGKKTENYNGGLETTVTGEEKHTVNGSQTNEITGSQTNTIGGNQTTIVTGDSSLSANNITNTATEKLSNSAAEIENTASTSITDKVGGNTTWKMTDGKISESIVNGTASNKENTTVDGTKRIITSAEGTGTYNQTATSNNISMKNAAGDTSFTKSESLDGEKTSVTNPDGSSTINQSAGSIVNFVKNKDGNTTRTEQSATDITNSAKSGTITNDAKNLVNTASEKITSQIGDGSAVMSEMTADGITNTAKGGTIYNKSKDILNEASGDILNFADGEIGNVATKITNITGDNTVTSNTDGTTFVNTGANTPVEDGNEQGSRTNTKIKGNTVETGKVMTDFADVNNNLTVGGSTTLGRDGGNTNLTVNSKSEFKDTVKMDKTLEVDGTSTFNDKVTITKNGLAVTGGTTTDTLEVKGTSEFGGKAAFKDDVSMDKKLTVKGAAEFKDDVSMGKNLTVTGKTETGTLHVNGNGYVGGNLNVEGNIETHDAELSADSRQVVTGRQLYQTNERVDRLDNRIKKVGANAAALAALRPGDFNPDDKFSIAAGFGSYRNASAAALGLFYRPNENVILSLGTSFGDGENMVNAGVSVKFGRGKSMAERRKEMAEEVSVMRDEMKNQNDRIAELEEMLKKQSELIEKLSKES